MTSLCCNVSSVDQQSDRVATNVNGMPGATSPIMGATLPVRTAISASGAFVPTVMPLSDGTNAVSPPAMQTVMYPTSSLSFGIPPNSVVPPSSAVPYNTGIPPSSAVTLVPPWLAVPAPMPSAQSTLSVPSAMLSNGVSQAGPVVKSAVAMFSDTSQAVTGNYVPNTAGYMGPWVWSANGPMPIGSTGAYGWSGGVSPPVGPQAATGWVTSLPEQARGTASATPDRNPLANPVANSATAPSTVNQTTGISGSPVPQSDVSGNAAGSYASPSVGQIGINGWPVNIPSTVGPPGTVGWVMGLPEQAHKPSYCP